MKLHRDKEHPTISGYRVIKQSGEDLKHLPVVLFVFSHIFLEDEARLIANSDESRQERGRA